MAKKKKRKDKGPKGTLHEKIRVFNQATGEFEWISPGEIVEGPIQQQDLSPEQQAICKYTFARAGKHVQPNLEKWELGFMRDLNVDDELVFWLRVACVVDKLPHVDSKRITAELSARSVNPSANVLPEVLKTWNEIDHEDSERTVAAAMREAGLFNEDED